jgi:riboflavin kinase
MSSQQKQIKNTIHLPDIEFYNWCSERFSIDRGVDNVIDHWFFENGIENITNRRTTIVQFLTYLQTKDLSPNSKMYLKFGKGGVKKTAIFRSELFGLRGL